MKTPFTFFLICISYLAICQPTITSGIMPSPGYVVSVINYDATPVSEGPAGASQNWNFSSVAQVDNFQNTFAAPATTPFASYFPGSNLTYIVQPGSVPTYNYYIHTSSSTVINGFGLNDFVSGDTVIFTYTDPETLFSYPFTYNSQFTDNFYGSTTFIFQGDTITSSQTGTVTSHADAYGTLVTPSGTFNNTLRIRTNRIVVDSTIIPGNPPMVSYINNTIYNWVDNTPGHLQLFQVIHDSIIDTQGNPLYFKTGSYQDLSVGINDVNLQAKSLAYPNPSGDLTNIDVSVFESGEAVLHVFDALGKAVRNETVIVGINKSIIIDTKEFGPGFYQLNIRQKDKLVKAKFIKQ